MPQHGIVGLPFIISILMILPLPRLAQLAGQQDLPGRFGNAVSIANVAVVPSGGQTPQVRSLKNLIV